MGQQDGGLRPRLISAMRQVLREQQIFARVVPVETGSVSLGFPDIYWQRVHTPGTTLTGFVECKQWTRVRPPTPESLFAILRPAQKEFYLESKKMWFYRHWIHAEWKKTGEHYCVNCVQQQVHVCSNLTQVARLVLDL